MDSDNEESMDQTSIGDRSFAAAQDDRSTTQLKEPDNPKYTAFYRPRLARVALVVQQH